MSKSTFYIVPAVDPKKIALLGPENKRKKYNALILCHIRTSEKQGYVSYSLSPYNSELRVLSRTNEIFDQVFITLILLKNLQISLKMYHPLHVILEFLFEINFS